jgi:hypothetical protein
MKYLINSFLFLIFFSNSLVAQVPPRDTAWGSWPHQAWYDGLLRAPVVEGLSQEIIILPNRQPFCYDKQIKVKMQAAGRVAEQCLYLNTTEGHVGYCLPSVTGGNICDIKPETKEFVFFIIGMKGNVYKYNNTEKNGTIHHWVSTGNSQTYQYQMAAGSGDSAVLHKKSETRMYCNDKIKAKAYKFDGSNMVWWLFGKNFPEKLLWKKYMGNFGVGYLQTDAGLYMILEMEDGTGNNYKITSAETVNTCFDPTAFQVMEDEMYRKRREALDKEQQKIERDEAAAQRSNECVSEKMEQISYRKELLRKQNQNLEQSQVGNAYQDVSTQNAMQGMMDPGIMIRQSIFDTKINICKTQKRMDETTNTSSKAKYQEKLSCLQQQLGSMQATSAQMDALDIQYADNPGMRQMEKSKLMMRNMPRGCN